MISKISSEILRRMSLIRPLVRKVLAAELELKDAAALTHGLRTGSDNILRYFGYTPVDVGGMTADQFNTAFKSISDQLKRAKDRPEAARLQDAIRFLLKDRSEVKKYGYGPTDSSGFRTDLMPKLVHVENAALQEPGNKAFLNAFARMHEANEAQAGEKLLLAFYRNREEVIRRAKEYLGTIGRRDVDKYADRLHSEYDPVKVINLANDSNFFYDMKNVNTGKLFQAQHFDSQVPLADRKFLDRRSYLFDDEAVRYLLEGKLNSGEHQLLNSLAKYYPALSTHNLADSPGNVRNAMRAKAKSFEAGEWKYTNRKR